MIYLVRHGQSIGNINKVFCGHTDLDLSIDGLKQAKAVAEKLKNVNADVIFSSPLKRAYNTALEISKQTGLQIKKDILLKEINFGIFENMTWDNITMQYPTEAEKWISERLNYRFVNGESMDDLVSRMRQFIKQISKDCIIVTHQGIIQALLITFGIANYDNIWDYIIGNCDVICIDDNGKIV